MATVTLPSPFGSHITLDINGVEAPRHFHEEPRRNFSAKLGAFVVNGKTYARLAYEFYIEVGKTSIRHLDWRAYDNENRRAEMTEKGKSKVRDAIEAAVLAFLATEEAQCLLKRADDEQRAALAVRCDAEIEALRQRILDFEALKADAANPEIPVFETAEKVRRA